MNTRFVCTLVCVLMSLLSFGAESTELRIALVLSNNSTPYQNFSANFRKNLPASIQVVVSNSPETPIVSPVDLIVAVGMKASEAAMLQTTVPVLATMIPQVGYDTLLANAQKIPPNVAAIYLNQPWERQLNFLFAVLPEHKKIGVLYSIGMQNEIAAIRSEASIHGGTLIAQAVYSDETLFSDLKKVLHDSEALLAVPDSVIYSGSNMRNILLTTYRFNVPIIGLSQAYVNAGAVAAIFSTPEQLAEQSANTVLAYVQTKRWPTSQFPNNYTIAVNQQVARSLGITLDTEAVIRMRMKKELKNEND